MYMVRRYITKCIHLGQKWMISGIPQAPEHAVSDPLTQVLSQTPLFSELCMAWTLCSFWPKNANKKEKSYLFFNMELKEGKLLSFSTSSACFLISFTSCVPVRRFCLKSKSSCIHHTNIGDMISNAKANNILTSTMW